MLERDPPRPEPSEGLDPSGFMIPFRMPIRSEVIWGEIRAQAEASGRASEPHDPS